MKTMKTKKFFMIVLALFMVLTILVVMAQGASEETKPKTLFVVLKSETQTDAFREIFARYEEETGNKVEIQILPSGEEFGRLMQTRFATKDYPDVFEMDPGTKQYVKFRAEETLYEWTNETVMDQVTDSTRDFQTLNGKIYGVPWSSTGFLGVFYNKKVFSQAGVSVPENYSEFFDVAKKLKDAGFIPIYEAINEEWPTQIFSLDGWTTYVDPVIGDEGVQAIEVNEKRLNEIAAFREVLQKQYDLYANGLLQPNPLAGTYDDQQEKFGQNKVGMVFQGAWFLGAMEKKFGVDYVNEAIGWFPLPGEDERGIATLYPAGQILVPRLGKNVEESVELVKFITRPENLAIWYGKNPGIPVYKSVEPELFSAQSAVLKYVSEGRATINVQNRLSSSFTDYPKILQNMYITGDIDAALKQLDENFRRTGKARNLPGF